MGIFPGGSQSVKMLSTAQKLQKEKAFPVGKLNRLGGLFALSWVETKIKLSSSLEILHHKRLLELSLPSDRTQGREP